MVGRVALLWVNEKVGCPFPIHYTQADLELAFTDRRTFGAAYLRYLRYWVRIVRVTGA